MGGVVPGQSKPSLMSVLASSKVASLPDKTLPENLALYVQLAPPGPTGPSALAPAPQLTVLVTHHIASM